MLPPRAKIPLVGRLRPRSYHHCRVRVALKRERQEREQVESREKDQQLLIQELREELKEHRCDLEETRALLRLADAKPTMSSTSIAESVATLFNNR